MTLTVFLNRIRVVDLVGVTVVALVGLSSSEWVAQEFSAVPFVGSGLSGRILVHDEYRFRLRRIGVTFWTDSTSSSFKRRRTFRVGTKAFTSSFLFSIAIISINFEIGKLV